MIRMLIKVLVAVVIVWVIGTIIIAAVEPFLPLLGIGIVIILLAYLAFRLFVVRR